MELTSKSENDIDTNLERSVSPRLVIANDQDFIAVAEKQPRKKRIYASRKLKEKPLENSQQVVKRSQTLKHKAGVNYDDTNPAKNPNFAESCTQSNKILNPFQLSLFLSILQQRRNNLFLNQPVSLMNVRYLLNEQNLLGEFRKHSTNFPIVSNYNILSCSPTPYRIY